MDNLEVRRGVALLSERHSLFVRILPFAIVPFLMFLVWSLTATGHVLDRDGVREQVLLIEARLQEAVGGGARLEALLGPDVLGSLQRQAFSVRQASPRIPELGDGPRGLFEEICAPLAKEADRKLNAVMKSFEGGGADWAAVGEALHGASASVAGIESAEKRIANALADPLWPKVLNNDAITWTTLSTDEVLVRTLADHRQALLSGDDGGRKLARAYLDWLTDPARLDSWGRLEQGTQEAGARLDEEFRRPEGQTGGGPSAWLHREASEAKSRFAAVDRSVDVARWRAAVDPEWLAPFRASVEAVDASRWRLALQRAKKLLLLHERVVVDSASIGQELANAKGVVPTTVWDRLGAEMARASQLLWQLRAEEAEVLLEGLGPLAEDRARWVALVGPMKSVRARWQQLPSAYQSQAGTEAAARLADSLSGDGLGPFGHEDLIRRLEVALFSGEKEWLARSLSLIPQGVASGDPRATEEWQELLRHFGQDMRLVPLREAISAAAAEPTSRVPSKGR